MLRRGGAKFSGVSCLILEEGEIMLKFHVWITGMSLVLDCWPVATLSDLLATLFGILLAVD